MGNLIEQNTWDKNVYQIEQTDPVLGGPDGIANLQAKALANRTQFLRALIGSFAGVVLPFAGSAAPTGFLLCAGQAVSRTDYAALFAVIGTTYGTGNGSTTFNLPDLRGRAVAGVDNMGGTAAGRLTTAAGGVNAATLGASGGAATHALTLAQMPSHGHTGSTATAGAHTHTGSAASAGAHTHSVSGSTSVNGNHNHAPLAGTGYYLFNGGGGQASTVNGNNTHLGQMPAAGDHSHTVSGTAASAGAHTHSVSVTSAGDHTHTVTVNANGGGEAHPNVQPTIALNYIIKF